MGRHSRVSDAQRVELWRRYRAGETVLDIANALGQSSTGNVYRVLEAYGGITPPQRCRAPRVLSFSEREEISRGVAAGETMRAIARRLGRAISTVSQELSRHGGRCAYRAAQADREAWRSARRPKRCLLACNQPLQRLVAAKLQQDWSPQQIAAWLRDQYPGNPERWVSHETIYRSLFIQARGALKKQLLAHLRSGRRIRRSRHAVDGRTRERILGAVSIRERPAEVEDRAVPAKSIFVTRLALGNVAATRTLTGSCDSIIRRAWISQTSARPNWMLWRESSILDHGRLWTGRRQPIFCD